MGDARRVGQSSATGSSNHLGPVSHLPHHFPSRYPISSISPFFVFLFNHQIHPPSMSGRPSTGPATKRRRLGCIGDLGRRGRVTPRSVAAASSGTGAATGVVIAVCRGATPSPLCSLTGDPATLRRNSPATARPTDLPKDRTPLGSRPRGV